MSWPRPLEHLKYGDMSGPETEAAIAEKLISEPIQSIFKYLATEDFELVVRKSHVPYDRAQSHLDAAGDFLSRFQTVISLNYDIFVYWAMIKWNAEHGHWFKDCF